MKFTPTVTFVLDAVPETARQIDDLLAPGPRGRRPGGRAGRRRRRTPASADPYKHDDERTTERPELRPARVILVVDKPAGWTSHQVVGRVRRLLGTRKVGHAGTLDPMATGVLVVGVNRATRLLGQLALTDKAYAATIRLGAEHGHRRRRGRGRPRRPARRPSTTIALEAALARADAATSRRCPSAVSAIKVDGVRSYARVRAGEEVDAGRPAGAGRPVRGARPARRGRRTACRWSTSTCWWSARPAPTSGRWPATWARRSACGGHLTALRRTRVGPVHPRGGADPGRRRRRPDLIGLPDVARRCFASR